MSAPTKGMVAGQAIKTGAQSKEWDEGFDRTFGERKRARGRFVWDEEAGTMVEVGAQWQPSDRSGALKRSEEEVYGGLRATDGTDISTKRRHREYMAKNGLTHTSDFREHWPKMEKERERILSGEADSKMRKEIMGQRLYEIRSGKK